MDGTRNKNQKQLDRDSGEFRADAGNDSDRCRRKGRSRRSNVLAPGKAFFTYDEAIAMFEQDQFPKGWRLPTYEEAAALLEEFTDEDDFNSHGFVQKLQLDFYGYVYPKMRDYNEDPTPTSEAIEGKYMEGRFWVYNPDRNSLYAIHVKRHGLPVLQAFGSNSGASIRLVLPTSM